MLRVLFLRLGSVSGVSPEFAQVRPGPLARLSLRFVESVVQAPVLTRQRTRVKPWQPGLRARGVGRDSPKAVLRVRDGAG